MQPSLVPPGKGRATWFLNTLVVDRVSGQDTDGAYSLTEQTLPPGFETPYHTHHAEDEGFYLLAGELEFVSENKKFTVRPGDYFHAPRDISHGFRVIGQETARVLVYAVPAGFEQFVVDVGEPAAALELPPPKPPDVPKLIEVAKRYGIDILGPLPA